jgi:hypothetical protein
MVWTGDITKPGGAGQEIQTELSYFILTAFTKQPELTAKCGSSTTFKIRNSRPFAHQSRAFLLRCGRTGKHHIIYPAILLSLPHFESLV